MNAPRRLAALPLPACLLRTTRRLTSSRFSPSGKSLPSSPLVLTTSRRIAPLPLLLIALLALGGVLLWSAPAQAQTATVLVSNTGKAESGSRTPGGTTLLSQSVDTGTNPAGYNLDSIVLRIATAATAAGTFAVTVREDTSDDPDSTLLYTLTNPGTIAAGLNEFTAPSGATLDANTTYHVVASFTSATGGHRWARALINAGLDSGAAPGWDMTTAYRRSNDSGATWSVTSPNRTLQMQVKGSAVQANNSALVKNTGQTAQSSTFQLSTVATKRTQAFTTGSHSAGYTLNSIGLSFGDIAEITTAGAQLTVTLNEVSGGDPGSVLCTLTDPATFTGAGVQTFDAPAADPCPTLKARTTYFAVIERVVFPIPDTSISLQITTSGDEDSGGAMGWTIGDARQFFGSGTWTRTASQSHLIEVRGTEAPYQPKRATGFDLHSDNSDPRGMWGNEDTFWVANDGSGATDKLYAYNRSDGSRDSANDFNNLNGNSNNQLDGICSDGTTMFVADSNDNKLYAYKMSDTTADSTKDITLDSDNGEARGVWCDATTVYVANDGSTSADNKVFAYTISSGAHDSTKDFEELYLSTNTAAQNAESPRGIWSNGTTMFVVDDGDDNVFAYKHSDESQDSAKNLPLISANAAPEGMWFDGRILWVVDRNDDVIYAYDLPGAQPDNTPAAGGPVVRSEFSRDVFTAEVTSAFQAGSTDLLAGFAVSGIFSQAYGSISESEFTLDGETYTVRAVYDGNRIISAGDLFLELDKALPRGFTFTADGTSYASGNATESTPGTNRYRYQWSASLSWRTTAFPVVLSVETPKDGEEVSADVSGITDSTDGVASASFHYEWIRVDGTDETDIDGATGATYTPTADDVDKHLKVRVVFDDDAGYLEYPRTSPQFGPVVDAVPPSVSQARAETATTIVVNFSEPLDPTSVPPASAFVVQVGGTAGPVDSVEIGEVIHSFIEFQGVLILTVSTPMLSGDTITVSYTRPDADPLQDPDRNEVESFSDEPVINEIRETFVSNLNQTTGSGTGDLATSDFAQRFDTGSTASFDFTEVEVLFDTAPGSSATVTAIIADGLTSSDNIVATLTNPFSWSTNPRFGIPSGTTLSHNTTYYLIIEGTGGTLSSTTSDAEDSGAAANWTIGNVASGRATQTDTGLGGTWTLVGGGISLQMAVRGKHHGRPGTPELDLSAKDQTLVLEVTVPDHGSSDLTGIEYSYKETTGGAYTSWAPVTGGTVSNSGGTFEIGGFDNGIDYTVQVQTVNDIGTSDPSNEDSATPDAPPEITSVAITSDPGTDKTYDIGDDIVVTFTFDKNITLSGMGTVPYFYLFIGNAEPEPDCAVGTAPTTTMACTHTVGVGDEDTDGIEVGRGIGSIGQRIVGPLGQFADTRPQRSRRRLGPQGRRRAAGAHRGQGLRRQDEDHPHLQRGHRLRRPHEDHLRLGRDDPDHHGALDNRLRGGDHPHHGAHGLGHQRDR